MYVKPIGWDTLNKERSDAQHGLILYDRRLKLTLCLRVLDELIGPDQLES